MANAVQIDGLKFKLSRSKLPGRTGRGGAADNSGGSGNVVGEAVDPPPPGTLIRQIERNHFHRLKFPVAHKSASSLWDCTLSGLLLYGGFRVLYLRGCKKESCALEVWCHVHHAWQEILPSSLPSTCQVGERTPRKWLFCSKIKIRQLANKRV